MGRTGRRLRRVTLDFRAFLKRRVLFLSVVAMFALTIATHTVDAIQDATNRVIERVTGNGTPSAQPSPSQTAFAQPVDQVVKQREQELVEQLARLRLENDNNRTRQERAEIDLEDALQSIKIVTSLNQTYAHAHSQLTATNERLLVSNSQLQAANEQFRVANASFQAVNAQLRAANSQLTAQNIKSSQDRARDDVRYASATVRAVTAIQKMQARTATTASVNLGSVFAESIPFWGIAVIVGATTVELSAACDTMADLHEMQILFATEQAVPSERDEVCGLQVPTRQEIWTAIKASPQAVWRHSVEAAGGVSVWAEDFEPPNFGGYWELILNLLPDF